MHGSAQESSLCLEIESLQTCLYVSGGSPDSPRCVFRVFLCKAGCLVFMVHQLHVAYKDAVEYVDRHPCNDMRQYTGWHDLTTWLKDEECKRKRPPPQDQPCQSPTRMIQKMWRGGCAPPCIHCARFQFGFVCGVCIVVSQTYAFCLAANVSPTQTHDVAFHGGPAASSPAAWPRRRGPGPAPHGFGCAAIQSRIASAPPAIGCASPF